VLTLNWSLLSLLVLRLLDLMIKFPDLLLHGAMVFGMRVVRVFGVVLVDMWGLLKSLLFLLCLMGQLLQHLLASVMGLGWLVLV